MTKDEMIDKIECLQQEIMIIRSRASTMIIIARANEHDCDMIHAELEKIAGNLESGLDANQADR